MTSRIVTVYFFLTKVFFHMLFTSDSFICGGKCHRPWHCGGRYGARQCGPQSNADNLIWRLFLIQLLRTMVSWRYKSIHNNTRNNQQTSPPWWWSHLPLQRRGFNDTTPHEGWGSLAHVLSKAAVEGFCLICYINVEINIFLSTLCLNELELVRRRQWWPKWHPSLLVAAHTIRTSSKHSIRH